MTLSPCDSVVERLAMGEPLDAVDDEHVATCPACSKLVTLPSLVAAAGHAAEPAPGFAVRTAAGTRTKLIVRRRKRIAWNVAAAAAAIVAGIWVARDPVAPGGALPQPAGQLPAIAREPAPPSDDNESPTDPDQISDEELLERLIRYADTDAVMQPSERWREAEAPLAPYRILPQGEDR
jgi:hypothetical protein